MNCKLCLNPHTELKYSVTAFDPPFDVYHCPVCGFQFQNIDPERAYAFYDTDYYTGGKQFSYLDERRNEEASRIVWQARMKRLIRRDRSGTEPKRFLDVGCAFGGLMQVAEESGYSAYGAEVSDYSAGYARERFGAERIWAGNVENISLPENYFSIVSMIEVIEHLYDPVKAIRNLYRAMRPGGVILIQTADMDGLQAKRHGKNYHYYLPGHLSYFTRTNLTRLMKETGFRRVGFFGGVEFGLLPKLRKSRYSFHKAADYLKWFRISWYHYLSKIALGRLHLTSSMVLLGWK